MRKFDTILFDLDGTLLNTLPDLRNALNHALAQGGYPTRTTEEVRAFVGSGLYNLVKRAMPEGTDEDTCRQVLAVLKAYYAQHLMDETVPYEGVPQLVQQLKADGYKIGIVSNKVDNALCALSKHFFGELVDFSLGEREDIPRKPAPDMIQLALKTLGSEAGRAVYVGDSEVDVKAAENAGVSGVFVDWGFRSHEAMAAAGAQPLCSSIEALTAALYAEE